MKDRIKKYIDYKGVSAGDLATVLDVQRSNISHILNGRNMPGALFIEKLLIKFPDLNARWLLTGVGNMLNDEEYAITGQSKLAEENTQPVSPVAANNEIVEVLNEAKEKKKLEKIILLFSDGSFDDYKK
jgi:transcriptional regulator with XRE-family HTH domain